MYHISIYFTVWLFWGKRGLSSMICFMSELSIILSNPNFINRKGPQENKNKIPEDFLEARSYRPGGTPKTHKKAEGRRDRLGHFAPNLSRTQDEVEQKLIVVRRWPNSSVGRSPRLIALWRNVSMVVLRFPHFVCIHSADQDININILISAMKFPVHSHLQNVIVWTRWPKCGYDLERSVVTTKCGYSLEQWLQKCVLSLSLCAAGFWVTFTLLKRRKERETESEQSIWNRPMARKNVVS